MSDLVKNINVFADHCGFPARRIFDDLFTLLFSHICTGKKEYQHLYPAVSYDPRTVQPLEGYRDADRDELMQLLVMLTAELDNAAPFEDVVTDKYGTLLQGDLGQFMTPTALSNAVRGFLEFTRESGNKRAEPTCGTGALVMGDLRQTYAVGGKDAVSHVDYSINDLDQRLVRIATVQVMYHSIRHEAPLKRLVAHNADLIRNYDSSPPFFAATSWRGVLPGQII
ncbi:hypothetical protein [Sinorhizobium meliloti]|uniref:hypothetical protein n=1 Tax=Rhizobium meliloti TaxID=382 RepID=UPI00398CB2DA